MAFVQLILSLVILSILYYRMIKRETPCPVSKAQAITPVLLGVASLIISFALFLGIAAALGALGLKASLLPLGLRGFFSAFFAAGLNEELAKLLMMIVSLRVFRSKIDNVYEYILIGAGVGMGFTLFEEFLYGSGEIISLAGRLITICAHMIFGVIMARHLGLARLRKQAGSSPAGEYAFSLLLPIALHTVYDALTGLNPLLASEDDKLLGIGLALSIMAIAAMFALQIIVLVRLKKKAGAYSEMTFERSGQ